VDDGIGSPFGSGMVRAPPMSHLRLTFEVDEVVRVLDGEVFVDLSDGTAVIVVLPDRRDVAKALQLLRDRLDEFEVLHRSVAGGPDTRAAGGDGG